jgi:TRAP-type mannitol/chloroaromatic compound transport system permease large subunit
LGSVIRGTIPFYLIYLLAIALIIVFPQIVLWLPGSG